MAKVMSDKNNQSISTYGSRTYLSTGIDSLDEILNGGIRSSLVTEIVGKAGIGKTQICLTVSVMTSSKGIGVIYFDTEGKFSPMRLMEIALNRKVVGGAMSESARDFADRIILFKPQSSMELLNQLDVCFIYFLIFLQVFGNVLLALDIPLRIIFGYNCGL